MLCDLFWLGFFRKLWQQNKYRNTSNQTLTISSYPSPGKGDPRASQLPPCPLTKEPTPHSVPGHPHDDHRLRWEFLGVWTEEVTGRRPSDVGRTPLSEFSRGSRTSQRSPRGLWHG